MPAPTPHRFPPGKTLTEELCTAMKRIEAYGVVYPAGYYRALVEKYTREGIRYPHILMIIGQPRINNHFFYSRALKRSGRLLDYGCGTGDNVGRLSGTVFPGRGSLRSISTGRASISGLTCTVTKRRSATSSSFQGVPVRAGGVRDWCIPPQFFTLSPTRGNSERILRMRGPPSGPGASSLVPRLGLWKGRPGLPMNGGRHGLCRERS